MILQHIDSAKYKEEFKSRFENFGNKAPIVISYSVDDFEVTVKHENSKTIYHYPWDFTMPVKSFIHKIKQDLSYHHYPRICREVEITKPVSAEKQAEMIVNGVSVDEIPEFETIQKTETFRIDKILAMKDEFVIINEETGEQFSYKMNSGSAIFFLKNYREGQYKDPVEAGEVFFKKSTLINILNG